MKHIKTYEQINEKDILHYVVTEDYFKKNNYRINQYNHDLKNYTKVINQHLSIFCNNDDKKCIITEYPTNTIKFIEYYMKEYSNTKFENIFINDVYYYAYYNEKTKEILNQDEYDIFSKTKNINVLNNTTFEKIWYIKDTWDELIEEFNKLTNGYFTKSEYYNNWLMYKNAEKYNL